MATEEEKKDHSGQRNALATDLCQKVEDKNVDIEEVSGTEDCHAEAGQQHATR